MPGAGVLHLLLLPAMGTDTGRKAAGWQAGSCAKSVPVAAKQFRI